VNYQNFSPAVSGAFSTGCAAGCSVSTYSCTVSFPYWSSTTEAFGSNRVWNVDFNDGVVRANTKTASRLVRAVRGGQ
jgi:hypothetical protein